MKNHLILPSIFKNYKWAKNMLQNHAVSYFYLYYLEPLIEQKGKSVNLFKSNTYKTVNKAIRDKAFKEGIIHFFFNENNYILDAKQLAIGISMGVFGHSSDDFLEVKTYDIAEYLIHSIFEKARKDFVFKSILSSFNKDLSFIDTTLDARDVISTLRDKKSMINTYVKKFEQKNGSDIVTVYYPDYDESWIGYQQGSSIKIKVSSLLPKGLILKGFDYKSKFKGFLKYYVETEKYNTFNSQLTNNDKRIIFS